MNEYMLNTAAVYKFINDQTFQYLNDGYVETECAHMVELPAAFVGNWYTRDNMTAEMLWDYLGIIIDKQAMADSDIQVNVKLSDTGQEFRLRFYHGPVLHFEGMQDANADVTLTGPLKGMQALMGGDVDTLKAAVQVEGNEDALSQVVSNIHPSMGVPAFNIVEP